MSDYMRSLDRQRPLLFPQVSTCLLSYQCLRGDNAEASRGGESRSLMQP